MWRTWRSTKQQYLLCTAKRAQERLYALTCGEERCALISGSLSGASLRQPRLCGTAGVVGAGHAGLELHIEFLPLVQPVSMPKEHGQAQNCGYDRDDRQNADASTRLSLRKLFRGRGGKVGCGWSRFFLKNTNGRWQIAMKAATGT